MWIRIDIRIHIGNTDLDPGQSNGVQKEKNLRFEDKNALAILREGLMVFYLSLGVFNRCLRSNL